MAEVDWNNLSRAVARVKAVADFIADQVRGARRLWGAVADVYSAPVAASRRWRRTAAGGPANSLRKLIRTERPVGSRRSG